MGVASLNRESAFAAAYERGIAKSEYWTYTLEDSLSLIARLPALAARIYRNVYNPGTPLASVKPDLDLVGMHRYDLARNSFLNPALFDLIFQGIMLICLGLARIAERPSQDLGLWVYTLLSG